MRHPSDPTRWSGQSRWGQRLGSEGVVERDEDEANVVAVVRHMRASGYKLREIVEFLAEMGVVGRTGRPIGTTRVFEMIHGGRSK